MRVFVLTLLFFTTSVAARADVVTWYNFTGNTGKEELEPPFFTAPRLSATALVHGDGLTADATAPPTLPDSFIARNWVGPEPDDYFTFTLTPGDGFSLEIASVKIGVVASDGGPTSAVLRSSLDGFTSDLGMVPVTLTHADRVMELSASSLLLTAPVEFRIIGLGASNNGASFGLTSADGAAGVIVNGTVTPAAVPEPSAGLLLASTTLIGYRRRQLRPRSSAAQ